MSKKRKNVFIILLIALLTVVMVVPVSASTTGQKKKALKKSLLYYTRDKDSRYRATPSKKSYSGEINKEGFPDHVEYLTGSGLGRMGKAIIIYTCDKKYRIRKYVFDGVSSELYRTGKNIVFETFDGYVAPRRPKYSYGVYTIKNGKMYVNRYSMVSGPTTKYYKNGKRISYKAYAKFVNSLKPFKDSSYWRSLCNGLFS